MMEQLQAWRRREGTKILSTVLLLVGLLTWPKTLAQEVGKELNNDLRTASVMDKVLSATFEALRQFKSENGYLPAEDNQSTVAALLGKNKIGKNYLLDWNPNVFDNKRHLLDVTNKPLVFHFINDNEITIYSAGTQQQLRGFLNSDKATVTQEAEGAHK
jgi:hypothetical protein